MLGCKRSHLAHGGRADAALWNIDDPQHSQVIHTVGNCLKVGQDVLDFPPLVEVHASHQTVRHIIENAPFLYETGLGIGPVEHGLVLIGKFTVPYLSGHIIRLIPGHVKLLEPDQIPFPIGCPQGLILPSAVVADNAVCRIEDVLGGAVILLQLNDLCPRKC